MSNTASDALQTTFSREFHHAFQQKMELFRPLIRVETAKGGVTHRFHKIGKMSSITSKTRHADLAPTDIAYTHADASLVPVIAYDYFDSADEVMTNLNLRQALVESALYTCYNKMDNLVATALGTASGSISETSMSTANTLDKAGLIKLGTALTDNDVPYENRSLFISSGGEADILGDTTLTSRDYVATQMMQAGYAQNVMGFNVRRSAELPDGSTGIKNFAFHKNAVGLAIARDITVRVDYVPEKTSWLVLAQFVAGAVVIDNDGVAWCDIAAA